MMLRRFSSLATAAVLLFVGCSLPLQGYFASVKALGMGGCGVAYPQDALAAAYNPAGMVWVGTRADLGAQMRYNDGHVVITDSTIDNNGTFSADRGRYFAAPDVGFNWMVFDSCDVAIGAVFYTKEFFKASYSEAFPLFGTTPLSMELWQGVLSPVFSIRFESFSFGISADFIGQRLKVRGMEAFDDPLFTTSPGNITNRKESFTGGITYTLGGLYKWTKCLSIGGMWQLHAKAKHFRKYRGLVSENGELQIPTRIVGGLYWRFAPSYGLAFDVEHISWNKVRWWHHNFPDTTDELTLNPFGSAKGPGFGWQDQTIFHVGTDIKLSQAVVFRLGYRYARSPMKKDEVLLNILHLDTVEQDITVGCTIDMCTAGEFSAYYSYGVQHAIKGPPIGGDFGAGSYTLVGQRHSAGLSMGWGW
ncbi:MAG: hypothetical protein Q8K75_07970 [Chlamydiales bacterium]|nr:hypothetical protein [Chlamydiales bacterium]